MRLHSRLSNKNPGLALGFLFAQKNVSKRAARAKNQA
jgi:hypothetical protein